MYSFDKVEYILNIGKAEVGHGLVLPILLIFLYAVLLSDVSIPYCNLFLLSKNLLVFLQFSGVYLLANTCFKITLEYHAFVMGMRGTQG